MANEIKRITTLADILVKIEADASLSPRKQQDWASALRSFGKHTGKGLGLVASPIHLRPALSRWSPQSCSKKTWANVRSSLSACLKHYGCLSHGAAKTLTGQAWAPLRAGFSTQRLERGLSRLLNWMIKCGIHPESVTAQTFEDYEEYLTTQTLMSRPDKIYRDSCQLWNRAVMEVPGWRQLIVTIPQKREVITLGEQTFAESFVTDLNAWERRAAGKDLLNRDSAIKRPLRPATIQGERATFVRCASILVRENVVSLEDIRDLSALTNPEHVRAILQFQLERNDNEISRGIEKTAITLLTLARNWTKVRDDELEDLRDIVSRLKIKNRGMAEKAEKRLSQFDDDETLRKFINLPWELRKEAKRTNNQIKAAVKMRLAVGIAIGLSAPMRRRNLVDLHLERNISIRRKGRRTECYIHFDKAETKTRETLDFVLNPEVTELLIEYRDFHRANFLIGKDTGWLFPGAKPGRPLTKEAFTDHLSKQVKKRLGIEFNCHLFRHLAAKIYLKHHPEDFATVQMLLGHRQAQTTIDFYCKFDRDGALARFDDAVFNLKDKK